MPISTSCIVKTEDLTWWPHLRDIDIPVLENGGLAVDWSQRESWPVPST